MKRLIFSLTTVAAMFAGCQKPELEAPVQTDLSFVASVEAFDTQTKTSLASENQIVWSSEDRVAIFSGRAIADEYQLADGCEGLSSGSFDWVARDNTVNYDINAGSVSPCNVAYYPYSHGMILSGDVQDDGEKLFTIENVVLPEVQIYAENSLGTGAFPMVAVTKNMADHLLKFKNLCGVLKLQFQGTQSVKSIKIEGLSGEKLSGAATVTAYADNLKPAIKMSSDALAEVTLDCGDGVQLSTAEATDFYIVLPPVSFENGFNVTITDINDAVMTLTARTANTVLRSSILTMPVITFPTVGAENPGDEEDELILSYVSMSPTSLKLYAGYKAQLKATFISKDATDQTVVWSSSDVSVATVDQTGLVQAVSEGIATIYATLGGMSGTCSVTVKPPVAAMIDYVDEYGVNHGKGVAIGMAVWAPVNCGYHETDYQWGKLYQWGRKYGQGHPGKNYDLSGSLIYSNSDATTPNLLKGVVSEEEGNNESNANVFYYGSNDWASSPNQYLWNSGTESSPLKAEADPCPEGWRVPTLTELLELCQNYSAWTTNDKAQPGYWFCGASSYTDDVPQVFFPAAAYRDYYYGRAYYRGREGYYWTSTKLGALYGYGNCPEHYVAYQWFDSGGVYHYLYPDHISIANGHSVRCVQDLNSGMDLEIPVLGVTLNSISLKLHEGYSAQLEAKVRPTNATNKSVLWSSSDATVATVDQAGLVTAVSLGTAEIYAQAGDVVATCSVEVKGKYNYIDEEGIDHGPGLEIGDVVWAPVNCGYHQTDYPWGKLYQWGRKYGQGYDGDATTPELLKCTVSLQEGQSANNKNVFYIDSYDWLNTSNDILWNSGTDESPKKTEYDPCPSGWRVPTYIELNGLFQNSSGYADQDGQQGYWFTGASLCSGEDAQVFFPAAGHRPSYPFGNASLRGNSCRYWSSKLNGDGSAYHFNFYCGTAYMDHVNRANGLSVRCVQE